MDVVHQWTLSQSIPCEEHGFEIEFERLVTDLYITIKEGGKEISVAQVAQDNSNSQAADELKFADFLEEVARNIRRDNKHFMEAEQ